MFNYKEIMIYKLLKLSHVVLKIFFYFLVSLKISFCWEFCTTYFTSILALILYFNIALWKVSSPLSPQFGEGTSGWHHYSDFSDWIKLSQSKGLNRSFWWNLSVTGGNRSLQLHNWLVTGQSREHFIWNGSVIFTRRRSLNKICEKGKAECFGPGT